MTAALPAGIVIGASTYINICWPIRGGGLQRRDLTQASTGALITLLIRALWVLAVVARPYRWWRVALVAVSALSYVVIFALPLAREKFMLDPSNVGGDLGRGGDRLVAAALIEGLWWIQGRWLGEPRRVWR